MEFQSSLKKDGIYEGIKYDAETNNKWKDMLVPEEMRVPGGEQDEGQGLKLDLNTLLKVLDQHASITENEGHSTTWQLVVIQAILLCILVLVAIAWACCCKKNCIKSDESPRVQAALRKLSSSASIKSRDFPPSYSQADLYTLAMSVQDYLYPPPDYPDVFNRTSDDLAYLDLEGGHRRMSKLSFSNQVSPTFSQRSNTSDSQHMTAKPGHATPEGKHHLPISSSHVLQGLPVNSHPTLSRQSTWSSLISPHAPLSRQSTWTSSSSGDSRKSSRDSVSQRRKSSLKDPSSRRSSLSPDSRRGSQSRISFNEAVECSNGSYRRLSSSQEHPVVSRQSSTSSLPHHPLSRLSSSPSIPHLSRQSSGTSLAGESARKSTLLASRKLGLSQESINEALKKKLEAIEQEDIEYPAASDSADNNEQVGDDVIVQIELDQPRISLETVIEVENH